MALTDVPELRWEATDQELGDWAAFLAPVPSARRFAVIESLAHVVDRCPGCGVHVRRADPHRLAKAPGPDGYPEDRILHLRCPVPGTPR